MPAVEDRRRGREEGGRKVDGRWWWVSTGPSELRTPGDLCQFDFYTAASPRVSLCIFPRPKHHQRPSETLGPLASIFAGVASVDPSEHVAVKHAADGRTVALGTHTTSKPTHKLPPISHSDLCTLLVALTSATVEPAPQTTTLSPCEKPVACSR